MFKWLKEKKRKKQKEKEEMIKQRYVQYVEMADKVCEEYDINYEHEFYSKDSIKIKLDSGDYLVSGLDKVKDKYFPDGFDIEYEESYLEELIVYNYPNKQRRYKDDTKKEIP